MKSSTRQASPARGARPARPREDRQEHLLEAFVAYCQACLVKDEAVATRESLVRRGFRADRLANSGLGRFTSSPDVHDHLASMGFSAEEIEAFSSATAELSGGWLVGPVRDAGGRLATFFAIDLASHAASHRCIYLRTPTPVPAVGLDVALGRDAGGRQHLVLVEDVLDALVLHSHSIRNVTAIGDPLRAFTARRWEALASLGVESVTLVFNARGAPHAALLDSLDESFHAAAAPVVWAVDPAELGKSQTAGELIRQGGVRAWEEVLRRRHHGYRWRARSILFRHAVDGEFREADRQAVMEEAQEFERLVGQEARQHDLEAHFWPPILKVAEYRPGRPPTERPTVAPPAPETPARLAPATAPATLADEIEPHARHLRARHGRSLLGLGQRTIAGLDEATLGFRGLMVLCGPPRCGKSSLAWQWATDVAAHNSEACVLFVSLKWPCYELLTRTKTRLAGLDWRTIVQGANPAAKADEHSSDQQRRKLQAAESAMADWGRRVRVVDRGRLPRPSVPSVLSQFADLKTRSGARCGLIVVDCLEAWPPGERSAKPSGRPPGERRMRLIERLRGELDDETALLVVSESASSAWLPSSAGNSTALGAHAALTYLPDALLVLSPGAATADPDAEQRLSLDVVGGRHGVRSARIELVHRLEQSEFVVAPAAPRGAAPTSGPASPHAEPAHARQRFTWGPYDPTS